ncbi:MAG: hypothetical protein RL379_112 [Bacillota bacterium]|jgi:hypothetical protein
MMKLFNFKRIPQSRIQKFAKYRRQILKMNRYQLSQDAQTFVSEQNAKSFHPSINILMWIMGATVIILLILVVALVYFGR